MGVYYPAALIKLCMDMRDQGKDGPEIAQAVRENFPQHPRFSARAAMRVGTRYVTARSEKMIPAAPRVKPLVEATTCQYVTFRSWPGACGAPGYPYCAHHKRVISLNEGYATSWPQFKSYG